MTLGCRIKVIFLRFHEAPSYSVDNLFGLLCFCTGWLFCWFVFYDGKVGSSLRAKLISGKWICYSLLRFVFVVMAFPRDAEYGKASDNELRNNDLPSSLHYAIVVNGVDESFRSAEFFCHMR